jgi:hypothetical protein
MSRAMKAAFLALLAAGMAGCSEREQRMSPSARAPADASAPAAPEITLMGHFERRMAVGGETTGWTLVSDHQRIDASFSVAALAQVREGAVFAAKGTFQKRIYPERGEVQIFVIRTMNEVIID